MRHDETVVTVAGMPVRAYRAGAGPPLVLLHGGGPDGARLTWEPIWDTLTPRFSVVAPDLPGYGGRWVVGFLDACGLGAVTLVGVSLGGRAAVRTALDEPARVSGLVLFGRRRAGDDLAGVACPVLAADTVRADPILNLRR